MQHRLMLLLLPGWMPSAEIRYPRKELESFLGLTNYYARYIQSYSERVEPLTALRSRQVAIQVGTGATAGV